MEPVQKSVDYPVADYKPEAQPGFSKTAGILMDLKLPVRILFGSRSMRLNELLKLSSGSIVELDREPDDTVELLVNDRVIARGQVVDVQGCYGIRITEILANTPPGSVTDLVGLCNGVS
jgi:flagellar motor switch protein FliN/FliY